MLLFLFFFIYAAAGTPATRLIYKLSADMMAGVEMFGRLACTADNECSGFSGHYPSASSRLLY